MRRRGRRGSLAGLENLGAEFAALDRVAGLLAKAVTRYQARLKPR